VPSQNSPYYTVNLTMPVLLTWWLLVPPV